MKSNDYNEFLRTIKAIDDISSKDIRKQQFLALKTRIITDYGLNDDDAQRLIKKIPF